MMTFWMENIHTQNRYRKEINRAKSSEISLVSGKKVEYLDMFYYKL